jgi:A/G-specific adenine glycosylase
LLALARDAEGSVPSRTMERAWPEPEQRQRCLAGLVTDGLLVPRGDGYALPA